MFSSLRASPNARPVTVAELLTVLDRACHTEAAFDVELALTLQLEFQRYRFVLNALALVIYRTFVVLFAVLHNDVIRLRREVSR